MSEKNLYNLVSFMVFFFCSIPVVSASFFAVCWNDVTWDKHSLPFEMPLYISVPGTFLSVFMFIYIFFLSVTIEAPSSAKK